MKRWKTQFAMVLVCNLFLAVVAVHSAAAQVLDDADITLAVERRLMLDDTVPLGNIHVSTRQGIVTLTGSVSRLQTKFAAGFAAETVRGVLGVYNEIVVEPLPRLDAHIRGDVIAALAADPVTEVLDIEVTVESRIVTLAGTVGSHVERSVAGEVARGVAGVADVRNLLAFAPIPERTDAAIADEIQYRLRADATLASGMITVVVDRGEVTLGGSVRSAGEMRRAEDHVWTVAGVRAVENNIDVQWWRRGEAADWHEPWTDGQIQEAIEQALRRSPRVNAADVTTTVREGVAHLAGTVGTLQARRAAEEAAWNVLGVVHVQNNLSVQPHVTREDGVIAEDIRAALQRNPHTAGHEISVAVAQGRAQLRGTVDRRYVPNQAEAIAAAVPGVVEIQNELTVAAEIVARPDAELQAEIESQLRWSPQVDHEKIAVTVEAGVATLEGTVDHWTELRAAMEIAQQAGATSVVSNLQVRHVPQPAATD